MPRTRSAIPSSRVGLTLLFLVVLLAPAATLIWLGIQILEQDRFVHDQRERDRHEAAMQSIVLSLSQSLTNLQDKSAEELPEGAVSVVASASAVEARPVNRLLWVEGPDGEEIPSSIFLAAEQSEYRGRPDAALQLYEEQAQSSEASIRAGALIGIARIRRKAEPTAAIPIYRELSSLRGFTVDGMPIDLLARRAICELLEEAGKDAALRTEVGTLEADLLNGRWILDRPTWKLAAERIEHWKGGPLPPLTERKVFSEAVDWLIQEWKVGNLPMPGRQGVQVEAGFVTAVWRGSQARLEALLISQAVVQGWLDEARRSVPGVAAVSLVSGGALFAGEKPDDAASTISNPTENGLPWQVVLSQSAIADTDFARRRGLMVLGLGAIIALVAGGGYFLWRAIDRELRVARLQTEFVAAVSHEFRTPLTSLLHVIELLQEDDGSPPGAERERRAAFYDVLSRNTDRLHRLVEALLDFSRMETGRRPWSLKPMDAGAFVVEITAEFQRDVAGKGVRIDCDIQGNTPGEELTLRADASALGHALWNLLDNAVKYSPEPQPVRVTVRREPRGIAISVHDEGIGIPAHEQKEIFKKFVRGSKASQLGIKGTGLGLALVSHIVEAHGGAIELNSEEGRGSTFTLVLPAPVLSPS